MQGFDWIRHDRLDDEVMVIDLKSGAYFAFLGAAADAWTLLVAGHEPEAVADRMAVRYGVSHEVVTDDITTFAGQLVVEGLLDDVRADHVDPVELGDAAGTVPYVAPAIEKFDDLADLLLLDPIHEVQEPGWPAGRQD
jgi:hypothetical protein